MREDGLKRSFVLFFNNQEDLSVLVGKKEEKVRKREIKKAWK